MTAHQRFAVTPHTADIGLDVYGKTLPKLFENAGHGLLSLLIDPAEVSMAIREKVRVEASDTPGLLVAWLNELIFLFQTQRTVPCGFQVTKLTETALEAEVDGELMDPLRHHALREIKSATYHELKIEKTPEGFQGHVLLDV